MSDQNGINWDGTGLGLSICAQLSTQINGFIKYQSVMGEYTAFRLYIPVELTGEE